ncbi:hypothetical protein F442_20639 [Phytophthora nicotianae P10297]|uniref:Uncharacterized protein n=1 Tax=Phytophthora nicotianae P10297 TaxID=1317064 RepID=W2Y5R2_PHYNI|nr:hypothetical protein F442_20639 [Phytophthora nicotianae P10297]
MDEHRQYLEEQYEVLREAERAVGIYGQRLESLAEAVQPHLQARSLKVQHNHRKIDQQNRLLSLWQQERICLYHHPIKEALKKKKRDYGYLRDLQTAHPSVESRNTGQVFCDASQCLH